MNAEFESKATLFTLILEHMRERQSTKKWKIMKFWTWYEHRNACIYQPIL